ncbi:MAG: hypothetical protein AAF234_11920 [Pseudomonadota bacterium]
MSTTYDDLFNAILAMDAYNRGYGPGLDAYQNNPTAQIGDAAIAVNANGEVLDSTRVFGESNGENVDEAASFYAIAYQLNGETIISYRGTDDGFPFGADLPAWATGAGVYSTPQTLLAAEFYQGINGGSIASNDSITLTGHSLGGGLAGFVGSIYGVAQSSVARLAQRIASIRLQVEALQLVRPAEPQRGMV